MTNDIKAIADGLSEALRAALCYKMLWAEAHPIVRNRYNLMGTHLPAAHRLYRKGLLDRFTQESRDRHCGAYKDHYFALTPLGLQVRDYLLKEKDCG